MIWDKVFTQRFLEELRAHALKKDSYSSTTYSIVYNLIQERKIKIIFNTAIAEWKGGRDLPSLPKKEHPEEDQKYEYSTQYGEMVQHVGHVKDMTAPSVEKSNHGLLYRTAGKAANTGFNIITGWDASTKLTMRGGYDPIHKNIKIVVWFYLGVEWEKLAFKNIFKKVFNNILAALLHEGIYLYNNSSNGLALNSNVTNWYKLYFSKTIMDATNRTTIARFMGDYLGSIWPKYIFDNIEKPLIRGEQPAIKEKVIMDKKSSVVQNKPLIADYIKGPFKLLLGKDLPERFDMDIESMDDVQAYVKDFIEFVTFMYLNKTQQFNINDLKSVPKFNFVFKNLKTGTWTNKCLGFEVVGDYKYFDEAYDQTCDIKDPYETDKNFFKKNYIFSEMYMPSTIEAKMIYYSVLRNTVDDINLRLIDCATKGLSSL